MPRTVLRWSILVLFAAGWAACGDENEGPPAPDVSTGDAGDAGEDSQRDVTMNDAEDAGTDSAEDVTQDAPTDTPEDTNTDVVPDVDRDGENTGVFPDDPTGHCTEGGDGAFGRITFDDGTPLAGATIAVLRGTLKHLGITNEEGEFYIQAPCEELAVDIAVFESENYPTHPSIWDLPLGGFDASQDEPTFVINLVTVEGLIVDILGNPIPRARVNAELNDNGVRVLNQEEAADDGTFGVNLVPWPRASYDITAQGPEDSEKRYRSATLSVLIGDPPPEPATFTLFEDRCVVGDTIHTSEGTTLDWLYLRVEGDPYPDGPKIYYSFEDGIYYEPLAPDVLYHEIPTWCGVQTLRLWNAIWLNPDWPCKDHDYPDQVCLNNFPLWLNQDVTLPEEDGIEIRVVRIGGTVTDEFGLPQRDVTVMISGEYQWGESAFDTETIYNEVVTDEDGNYSMVVIPLDDVEYVVRTRIRDDDRRPLGAFEGTVEVPEATTYDIVLPEGPPRCVLTGTIHSSEGHVHNEVQVSFQGVDAETDEPLYTPATWSFFTGEPEIYYRSGFPDEEVPFIPFLCGIHDLALHSMPWDSCNLSADEVCFYNWGWWSNMVIDEPIDDGIEIPVVHVSGFVTTTEGEPVEGAAVNALGGFPPFSFVTNSTGTGPDGLYDFVVLPGMEWNVAVSVGDDHPLNLAGADETVFVEDAVQVNFEMPPGPVRCPFRGTIRTTEGVELESLSFYHFGEFYGLAGWQFVSLEPGVYYRYPNDSILLDNIPLICGEQPLEGDEIYTWTQDFIVDSIYSSRIPSCIDPNNYDQPCLDFFAWRSDYVLTDEETIGGTEEDPLAEGIEIPVVWISGIVTKNGSEPIPGANVEVRATITLPLEGGGTRVAGQISNYATTRPDGRYQLVVMPSELSTYNITITTPVGVDLGQVVHTEVVTEDITVDADFTVTE